MWRPASRRSAGLRMVAVRERSQSPWTRPFPAPEALSDEEAYRHVAFWKGLAAGASSRLPATSGPESRAGRYRLADLRRRLNRLYDRPVGGTSRGHEREFAEPRRSTMPRSGRSPNAMAGVLFPPDAAGMARSCLPMRRSSDLLRSNGHARRRRGYPVSIVLRRLHRRAPNSGQASSSVGLGHRGAPRGMGSRRSPGRAPPMAMRVVAGSTTWYSCADPSPAAAAHGEVLVSPDRLPVLLPWPALPGRRPDGYPMEDFSFAVIPFGSTLAIPTAARAGAGTARRAPDRRRRGSGRLAEPRSVVAHKGRARAGAHAGGPRGSRGDREAPRTEGGRLGPAHGRGREEGPGS